MPKYNIEELTEFPKALIYTFEPESTQREIASPEEIKMTEDIYPKLGQITDMLAGYLFAQNEILPEIKRQGIKNITSAQWLEWISKIHQLIAFNVAAINRGRAGEYTKNTITRWHDNSTIFPLILSYFSERLPKKFTIDTVAEILASSTKYSQKEYNTFLRIIDRINRDPSIKMTKIQTSQLSRDDPGLKGVIAFNKLQSAYYQDKLSAEEKAAIDKIVKIGRPAETLAPSMNKYADYLVAQIQQIDPSNDDSVIAFAAELFYQLADIHPFVNGNGRTATCLMNIMLKAFDRPAILLRLPGEKIDPDSRYSHAIANIDKDRKLLKELIRDRLPLPSMECDNLFKIAQLRMELINACQNIQKIDSTYDVDALYEELTSTPPSISQIASKEEQTIVALKWIVGELVAKKQEIEGKQQNCAAAAAGGTSSLSPDSFFSLSPSKEILLKLKQLTGISKGWSYYSRQKVALLTLDDESKIKEVTQLLNETNACTAEKMYRSDNQKRIPVCKISNIKFDLLLDQRLSTACAAIGPG